MTATPAVTCAICGTPQPLGLRLCPDCGGSAPGVADTLIFVTPGDRWQRGMLDSALGPILGGRIGQEDRDLVVRGHKALVRLPRTMASDVVEHLRSLEIPVEARRERWTVASVPFAFGFLLVATAVVGLYAGAVSVPALLTTTPVLTGFLLLAAQIRLLRPAVRPTASSPEVLPARVKRAVVDSLALLADGEPSERLASLFRSAESVLRSVRRTGHRALAGDIERLLELTSVAALQLADLETAEVLFGSTAGSERVAELRRRIADRFTHAAQILHRLHAEAIDADPIHAELADLVTALGSDADAYAETWGSKSALPTSRRDSLA